MAFAHELRRFCPFAPYAGGRAVTDLERKGEPIPAGSMVLLDLDGQNHDPDLWDLPYTFESQRFLERPPRREELVPQGAATAPPDIAAPARTSPSHCCGPWGHGRPGWSTRCPIRI